MIGSGAFSTVSFAIISSATNPDDCLSAAYETAISLPSVTLIFVPFVPYRTARPVMSSDLGLAGSLVHRVSLARTIPSLPTIPICMVIGIPSELRILRLWAEKDLMIVVSDGPIMEHCTTSLLCGNIRSREIQSFPKVPMLVSAFASINRPRLPAGFFAARCYHCVQRPSAKLSLRLRLGPLRTAFRAPSALGVRLGVCCTSTPARAESHKFGSRRQLHFY